MKRSKLSLVGSLLLFLFLIVSPVTVQANIFDDIISGAKRFVSKENNANKRFAVESNITLAPDGDIDKNGEISAGDIIRFEYILTNLTDKEYKFATLNTKIDRTKLNFIHNVRGTASLTDDGKTIVVPNFRILPSQTTTISFDARVNYFSNEDKTISTEAEFLSEDKKSISKSLRKEVKAVKISADKIKSMMKQSIEQKKSK